MKNATIEIEFLSHCLAVGVGYDGKPDHFQRDPLGRLVFLQSGWFALLSSAIDIAKLRGVKATDIMVDLCVNAETEVYSRRYGLGSIRKHEAIMPGTKVGLSAIVADHVTESVLRTIFENAGRWTGLSPFGWRLGFGRFTVSDVNVAPSDV